VSSCNRCAELDEQLTQLKGQLKDAQTDAESDSQIIAAQEAALRRAGEAYERQGLQLIAAVENQARYLAQAESATERAEQFTQLLRKLDDLLAFIGQEVITLDIVESQKLEGQWPRSDLVKAARRDIAAALSGSASPRQDEKPKCAHAGCELVLAFVGRNATPSKFCPEHAAPTAQDTRIGGLEKAQEIAIYHRDKYGERADKAWVAACNEIIVSCAATANRIKRGEYENPTSSVMSTQDKHKFCGGPGHCMECSLDADQKKLDALTEESSNAQKGEK
jgi:hypothetical protein